MSSPKFPFSYPDIAINSDLMGSLYLRPNAVKRPQYLMVLAFFLQIYTGALC